MEHVSLDTLFSEQPKQSKKGPIILAVILLGIFLSAVFLYKLFPNQLKQLNPKPSPIALPEPFGENKNSLSKLKDTVSQVFTEKKSNTPQNQVIVHYTTLADASQTYGDEYANYLKAYKEMLALYQQTKDPQIKYAITQLDNYLYYSPYYKEGDITIPQ